MGDIMRDTEMLRFRSQSHLSMPAKLEMVGDMLCWGTDGHAKHSLQDIEEYEAQFVARPVAGVLREFITLADATPEKVLGFVQSRGVLGIDPLVTLSCHNEDIGGIEGPFRDCSFDYAEPAWAYTRLASHFACIARIMGSLKTGRKVDDSDLLRCIGDRWGSIEVDGLTPSFKHKLLWVVVSECWHRTTIKLMPSCFDALVQKGERTIQGVDLLAFTPSHSQISVQFGDWRDGLNWDMESSRRTRPGGMIALPEDYIGGDGCDHSSGERVMPYCDYAAEDFYSPHARSRPSSLYNALVFQLMQALTLKEGEHFCRQCEKVYTYDPEKARKPAKGEDPKHWGNSQPRIDRPKSFCSEWCRRQHDTEDKRRSRAAARSRMIT